MVGGLTLSGPLKLISIPAMLNDKGQQACSQKLINHILLHCRIPCYNMLWGYGLSDDPSNTLFLTLLGVFVVYWLGWIIYTRFYHPLSKYPGPFLGSVSRSWLVAQVASGQAEVTQRALHDKLGTVSERLLLYILLNTTGPIVRIAPNEVAIADPNALKTIYAAHSGFTKVCQ
jgi:hypothetical protein